jgi:chromosome partitioning protein
MKIIALAQGKGGACKTTTAINLACEAVAAGESAAIVDLDQSQLSTANLWGKKRGDKPPKVIATEVFWLKGVLEKLEKAGMKWVFLDLPGRNEPTSGAGIVAADFVIIPTRPAPLDFHGSMSTVRACKAVPRPYAFVLSDVPPHKDRARTKQFEKELRNINQPVCPIAIGHILDVSDSIGEGMSIGEYKPRCASHVEFKLLFSWLKEQLVDGKDKHHR